jgi:hypothetical protein
MRPNHPNPSSQTAFNRDGLRSSLRTAGSLSGSHLISVPRCALVRSMMAKISVTMPAATEQSEPEVGESACQCRSPFPAAIGQVHRPDDEDEHGNQNPQEDHLQDEFVDGEQSGPNQMPLRADPPGDHHRAAAALQDRRHLGFVERAAEFGFLILELGTQILA